MTIHLITAGKYQNPESWPDIWKKCFDLFIKSKHDICIWNDEGIEKILKEDDEEFYNEYLNKLHPSYKWEYVRYVILEKYGGAYLDIDIELIEDFFDRLDPKKIYLMEGTNGTYVENSIMISPLTPHNSEIWKRIKDFSKNKITLKFKECTDAFTLIWVVGPQLLSEFFIKYLPGESPRENFDILAWEHFANTKGTFNFTKHWQTSLWNYK